MIKTVLVDIDVLSIVSSGDAHSAIAGRDGGPPVEWGHPVGAGRRSGNADAVDPGTRCRRASAFERELDPSARQARHGRPMAGPALCRRPVARRSAKTPPGSGIAAHLGGGL